MPWAWVVRHEDRENAQKTMNGSGKSEKEKKKLG
jgi:hypothetical protein